MSNFGAIDFETADHGRDSACAIGVVKVSGGMVIEQRYRLIRPPRQKFAFTHIHGLSWQNVKTQPTFDVVWQDVASLIEPSDVLLAHYASFDRSVLIQCCESFDLSPPSGLLPVRMTPSLGATMEPEVEHGTQAIW
jgi:DNA polymerase-3 subunit epsilon